MIKFCRREFTPLCFDPPALFRYFEQEDHARALCRGYVWISTLEACRRHEGMAHDPVNDAWVLCFTETMRPDGMEGTGRFGVRISRPRLFFRHVTNALRLDQDIACATLARVRYVGRAYQHLDPSPALLGTVKPPDQYSSQSEVRMVWKGREFRAQLEPGILHCAALAHLCSRI